MVLMIYDSICAIFLINSMVFKSGGDVQSKKVPVAAALQVMPAAALSNQNDAASFKSATVQLSNHQSLVANVKSSGQCVPANASKHLTPSSNTLSVQPALPCSKVMEQSAPLEITDSFVSASPSSQVESFSQPMWSKTGFIAVVEVPLHQHS